MLAALALFPAAARAAIPTAVTGAEWVEARTAHFRVISNAGERTAASVGKRLEQLTAFLAVANPGLRPIPAMPTDVYVIAGQELFDFYRNASMENALGFASQRPGRNVMVMNSQVDGADKNEVLCHEYIHIYNQANFVEVPLWLNEGLAEYYGTFRPRGRVAEFARKREGQLYWLSTNELVGFDVLFAFETRARGAMSDNPAYWKDNPLRNSMYCQGWLFAHYMGAERARSEKFQGFLNAIRGGETPLRAFETTFPRAEWAALLAELKRYVKEDFIQSRELAFPDPTGSQPPAVHTLPTGQVLTDLGRLLVDLGPARQADADEHLRSAVAADPRSARAWASLGRLCDERGDSSAAEGHYAKALALDDASIEVLLEVAMGTRFRAFAAARGEDGAAMARTAARAGERFARCLEQSPDHPEARAGLATALLAQGKSGDAIVRMLEAASRDLPGRGDIRSSLAAARERAAH